MSKTVFLQFENELSEIAAKIEALEAETNDNPKVKHTAEIARLNRELTKATAEIYRDLTPWQSALVARHPNRPYTLDYIDAIFEDFTELHGDRCFSDDQSIVGGLARLGEHSVMVIGHQKGRDTRERTRRNFGMSKPEGYRKALRLMRLAEKYSLPVFTFVDTPGAYPGIGAEERNQSEAIGRNLYEMSRLKVPVITTIIGEGGSGGALAIAVADVVLMLQYATYSVISPEGCASILWKDAAKAPLAAQALCLTAPKLLKLGLIDKVVAEPLGGAHRDPKLMASTLRKALVDQLRRLSSVNTDELIEARLTRLLNYGRYRVEEDIAGQAQALPTKEAAEEKPEKKPRTKKSEGEAEQAQTKPAKAGKTAKAVKAGSTKQAQDKEESLKQAPLETTAATQPKKTAKKPAVAKKTPSKKSTAGQGKGE